MAIVDELTQNELTVICEALNGVKLTEDIIIKNVVMMNIISYMEYNDIDKFNINKADLIKKLVNLDDEDYLSLYNFSGLYSIKQDR